MKAIAAPQSVGKFLMQQMHFIFVCLKIHRTHQANQRFNLSQHKLDIKNLRWNKFHKYLL